MEYTSPCNSLRRYYMNGRFKYREVKTGFCRKTGMQTGSSGTLIGWESGHSTYVPLWDRMEGAWLWTLAISWNGAADIYCSLVWPKSLLPNTVFCLGRDQSSFRLTAQANTYSCMLAQSHKLPTLLVYTVCKSTHNTFLCIFCCCVDAA